jgi:hypothetical protein
MADAETPVIPRSQDNGHRHHASILASRVESLARSGDIQRMAGEIDTLVREWQTMPADIEPAIQDRFRSAQSTIATALERYEAERAAEYRENAARGEAEAARLPGTRERLRRRTCRRSDRGGASSVEGPAGRAL